MPENILNPFTIYRRLLSLVPAEGLVVSAVEPDPDTDSGHRFTDTYTPSSTVRTVRDYLKKVYRHTTGLTIERLSEIASLNDLKDLLAEYYEEGGARPLLIGSQAEIDAKRLEEERQRLERTASQIAATHGVKLDSFEFIEVLETMIDRQKSYREGLREDGLCIGYGVSPEQWFEEYSSSRSDTASVHDLLDFLGTYCPLLMAQYRERKLSQEVSVNA